MQNNECASFMVIGVMCGSCEVCGEGEVKGGG